MKQSLGFIGLGLMGAPMANRLLEAGYTVHLFNRTKEKARPLIDRGGVWNESPADVARNAEIIFTMLTNDDVLRATANQIQSTLKKEGIHVDCSTVSPQLTAMLEQEYSSSDRYFLHSPVLGSIPQATDGTLLLFVGGSGAAFHNVEPLLKILGSHLWRFPQAEHASTMKLIMNSFIGGMMATLAQALTFARNAGLDGNTILDVLNHSALNSAMYQTKGKAILEDNFTPRFYLENLLKDMNLIRSAGRYYATPTPIADTVHQLLEMATEAGLGKEDYSAVIKILQKKVG